MVRLQRQFAYKYKGKDHFRHVVTIPDEVIQELGWKHGTNLELKADEDVLTFRVKKNE